MWEGGKQEGERARLFSGDGGVDHVVRSGWGGRRWWR